MQQWKLKCLSLILLTFVVTGSVLAVQAPTQDTNLPADTPDVLRAVGSISRTMEIWNPGFSGRFAEFTESAWQVSRFEKSGTIALAIGDPVHFVNDKSNTDEIRSMAADLFHEAGSQTGLDGCFPDIYNIKRLKNLTAVQIQAQIQNIPVYGSYAVFVLNQRGELVSIKARGYGSDVSGAFLLSEQEALASALASVHLKNEDFEISRYWLPTLTDTQTELRPAFSVKLFPANSESRPVVFVDAETSEILAAENRVYYIDVEGVIQGQFHPLYGRDEEITMPFEDEWIQIGEINDYTGDDGEFLFELNQNALPYRVTSELRGPWVDVNNEAAPDGLYRFMLNEFAPIAMHWDDQRTITDERGLFYHTNFIHDFWKDIDPDFDGLDFMIAANCQHGVNYDNAFWYGRGMTFGAGNEMGNFALYADIIYHEYTHGVTQEVYIDGFLPYEDESGALNEAWSDYFPCSITDEPLMGEGGLNGNGFIRNLDNNYVYPDDIRGEVHYDSRMISAAMWHTREVLGRDITDPLFHFSKYMLASDFMTYFADILVMDDDDGDITNGSPHSEVIYEQFGRHGIGPGVIPDISIIAFNISDDDIDGADGDDDGQFESGETVRVEIELFRDGEFYPPDADDVHIEMSCDHPQVDLFQAVAHYGEMAVGDRKIGDVPFLFNVDNIDRETFAEFSISLTADDGEYSWQKTFRIPLGNPPILVVRDGAEREDRTSFYETTLDSIGLVYDKFSHANPYRTIDQRLKLFDTVIWFTGDESQGILSEESVNSLEDFLDSGGNLLLTGQNASTAPSAVSFLASYLGVVSVIDSVNDFELHGVADDPVSDGMWLLLRGSPGALNQRRPDVIMSMFPAEEIYHWQMIDGAPAAGARRTDERSGAKTVFLGFGLEGVSGRGGTTTQLQALTKILEWFEVPMNAEETSITPVSFVLAPPYPNPFNGRFSVPIQLSRAEQIGLTVFDVTGRVMYSQERAISAGKSVWSIQSDIWGAGLYFARINSDNGSQTYRIALMK